MLAIPPGRLRNLRPSVSASVARLPCLAWRQASSVWLLPTVIRQQSGRHGDGYVAWQTAEHDAGRRAFVVARCAV